MAPNDRATPNGPDAQPPEFPPPPPKLPDEDEPIALVEPDESMAAEADPSSESTMGMSIRPMGSGESSVRKAIKSSLDYDERTDYKRTPVNTGTGAIRCRVFHSKIAESSMLHMQAQINAWLDDEDIEVKHVGHMVGALEGKHTEPNIIVMIWY